MVKSIMGKRQSHAHVAETLAIGTTNFKKKPWDNKVKKTPFVYWFSKRDDVKSKNPPPKGRFCYACGSAFHFSKECPHFEEFKKKLAEKKARATRKFTSWNAKVNMLEAMEDMDDPPDIEESEEDESDSDKEDSSESEEETEELEQEEGKDSPLE